MAISYDDPINQLKDKSAKVLNLKTNAGEKQIPNVA